MAEETMFFLTAGIYALIIFGLMFSFILGMRVQQLRVKVLSYEKSVDEKINTLKKRVEMLEEALKR